MSAKALGGLLRFKRTEKEWNYVKDSEIWRLQPEETWILPVLRLSYHHLPLALRQCFAYFAVFPKDFSISKEELIHMWMAHGYISSRGTLEVEDVGHEICNELVLRSLLQYDPLYAADINMHDLVHDLAQSIMESKVPGVQFERQVTSTASLSRIRQVNLGEKSVAFPTSTQYDLDINYILMKFSRLRVLDAHAAAIKDLPPTVGNLKHLRFLNLSENSEIRALPNSLCSLWNLEILNLNYCSSLVALPKNTIYLSNLRHLFLEDCSSLREMPSKIGKLTRLKTLSKFILGRTKGSQLEELQYLNLGDEIEIDHLERVETYMDAKKANLVQKKDLRCLRLAWKSDNSSEHREDKDEKVLEALQPHPNLETLRIKGFSGRCSPTWMKDSSLENIFHIVLEDCPNWLSLPNLGELPHLRFLRLEKLAVEYIDEIQDGSSVIIRFPSLKRLELSYLPHLKGLLKEQVSSTVFPKLISLRICSCSSFILPKIPSLQELEIENCSSLVLSSFPKLESLTSLEVRFGENMKCLPIEMMEKLSDLRSLTVIGAEEISLPEEGMRALKSLTKLWIIDSEALMCLPPGWLRHFTALKELTISKFPEIVELPEEIKYLNHLEKLTLFNVGKIVCLTKALQHLSSLKVLDLDTLPQLNSLPDWLDDLTSLQTLYIWNCPKLVSLPPGMPNLHHLSIRDCPELEMRCKRGTGEDWHKIAHIPSLRIGRD